MCLSLLVGWDEILTNIAIIDGRKWYYNPASKHWTSPKLRGKGLIQRRDLPKGDVEKMTICEACKREILESESAAQCKDCGALTHQDNRCLLKHIEDFHGIWFREVIVHKGEIIRR